MSSPQWSAGLVAADDHVGDVGSGGREDRRVLVGTGPGRPRGPGVDGDQVGGLADRDPAAPLAPMSSSSAALQCPRSREANRSFISRPRSSSNGSMTAWLSLPIVSRQPASYKRLAGPIPSARSRSVVGVMHTLVRVPPSSATSSSVRWVAWTTVVAGPSRPSSWSRRVGVTPYAARQSSFSRGCSERCTCSGSRPRNAGELVARDRADRVDRRRPVARRVLPRPRHCRRSSAPGHPPVASRSRCSGSRCRAASGGSRPRPRPAPGPRASRWARRTACRPVGGAGSGTRSRSCSRLRASRGRSRWPARGTSRDPVGRRRRTSARARSRRSPSPAGSVPGARDGRRGCGR